MPRTVQNSFHIFTKVYIFCWVQWSSSVHMRTSSTRVHISWAQISHGCHFAHIAVKTENLIPLLFDGLATGDKFSTDWDKAWSNFRKQGKKTLFSQFSPNKYVSWNPRRSDYPLSEEVDPIKRTERSNLMLWTSPRFTLVGAILVVTFLLVYTILYPIKWFN